MEQLQRKHIIVTIGMSILVVGSVLGLLYFGNRMKKKEVRVREVKQHLASYEQNKKIFIEENGELKELNTRVTNLEQYKITIEKVPQLLSSLEQLAAEKNILFSIDTVETPKPQENTKKLTIAFSAGGSYQALQSFLELVMHQTYQVRITTFSLIKNTAPQPGTTASEKPAWELRAAIEIMSY